MGNYFNILHFGCFTSTDDLVALICKRLNKFIDEVTVKESHCDILKSSTHVGLDKFQLEILHSKSAGKEKKHL